MMKVKNGVFGTLIFVCAVVANSVKCGLATALYSANYWNLELELEAEK